MFQFLMSYCLECKQIKNHGCTKNTCEGVGWDNGQTVPCNVCLHCASSLYNDGGLCHPMTKQMKVKGKGNEI